MPATIEPKSRNAIIPVTALAFLSLGTSVPYLLAGEGRCLKFFHLGGRTPIHTERVFASQAIHGITCKCLPQDAGNGATLLVWGGRSVCLIPVEAYVDMNGKPSVKLFQTTPEVLWDDCILDGGFLPSGVIDSGSERTNVKAVLVTAHNDLLALKCNAEAAQTRENPNIIRIASGPRSVLYSAHMLWADGGRRFLIAAGTVFGEVLLWSYIFDDSVSPEVCVHYSFAGHEGSVFGVRISDVAQTGAVKRVLASCSDDRTIRIWDISDTNSKENMRRLADGELDRSEIGLREESNEADSTGCLAMIMGHASRIWGLRFLKQKDGCWDLMSYGEDSTAQAWRLRTVHGDGRTVSTSHNHAYQLSHQTTYSYHSGKNLWAMAVFQEGDKDCVIATGGADGRITTYKPYLNQVNARTCIWTREYTMGEVSKVFQSTHSELNPRQTRSSTRKIFDSLKGSWKLLRNIDSVVPTYPSGTLEGAAILADRPPTDGNYDAECLYSESGDFKTQQGLTMRATRQYVYRYSRSTDAISVWFVKPDDGSAVDYFFHQLDLRDTDPGIDKGPEIRTASGYHLCVEDNYNANYSFQLKDSKIVQWRAVFDVDGPKKGYTTQSTYTHNQADTSEHDEPEYVIKPSRKDTRSALVDQSGQNKPDVFKTYTWLSENEVLSTTEQGNLLVGTLTSDTGLGSQDDHWDVNWEHVGHQTGLIGPSIATSISSLGVALLTGTDGIIYIYSHRSKESNTIGKLAGKAGFLRGHVLSKPWNRWLGLSDQREMVGLFSTRLGSSQATVFMFPPTIRATDQSMEEEGGFPAVLECHLTLSLKFIVTSSCFLDKETRIILGSRNGDIAIYDLAHTAPNDAVNVKPECLPDIHGEDAITLIQTLPRHGAKSTGRAAIITAGRDGKWAIHYVFHKSNEGRLAVTFQTIHVGVPPFGPNIEGAYIDSTTKDLLLWGFRSKHFVVWNESQKTEVMAVDCGGAHRNWAYTHTHDGSGGGTLVYTKASVCHIHSQKRASHQVIQHGGHGREIKAMAVSPAFKSDDDTELRLVATGAEDTAIRIFDLSANLKCLSIITKHTTGIQQLQWSPDCRLLFSAAGCEEFFVWRLQPAPLIAIGVVCEAQCPTVTEEADLRIMDFAVEQIHSDVSPDDVKVEPDYLLSMVYSDSSVRLFRYRTRTVRKPSFDLLTKGSYTTYCLTQSTHLHLGKTLHGLCTASTDGHLAFWPFPNPPPLSQYNNGEPTMPPIQWTKRAPIHQNSIKALDSVPLSPSETLIVTGGDDGAIGLTRVRIPEPSSEGIFDTDTLLLPRAHASAVTGIALIINHNHSDINSLSHPQPNPQSKDTNQTPSPPTLTLTLTLATTSTNQTLNLYHLSINTALVGAEAITITPLAKNTYTSIADASSLTCYRDGDGGKCRVLVAGIGIETWSIASSGRL